MNGLAQQYRGDVYVEYIDVEASGNTGLVQEYNATSIPLIVILDDQGVPVQVFRGLTPEITLRQAIDAALVQSAT